MWLILIPIIGLTAYLLARKSASKAAATPVLQSPSTDPKYNTALVLRGLLHDYGPGSSEVTIAARAFAKAADIKLFPGAGYSEIIRQQAAAVLGDKPIPSRWPDPVPSIL